MAGKHSRKGSNKPLIILIIVAVVVIAAIVAGGIFLMNGGIPGMNNQQEATQVMTNPTEATTVAATTAAASEGQTTASPVTEAATTAPAETGVSRVEPQIDVQVPTDEGVPVQVPTDEGVPVSYFNATYIPSLTAKDVHTGEEVSLREAFGTNYANSTLTFNSDGTFRDTLTAGEADSGAYVVQGEKIHATYTNDKNMKIEVTEWDNGAPVSFQVIYGDCIVYFGKN